MTLSTGPEKPPSAGSIDSSVSSASDEAVDHPAHYGGKENPYEAIKVIEAWELGFCLGNTVKYMARFASAYRRLPEGTAPQDARAILRSLRIQDLKKARWYLDRQIERLEASSR